VIVDATRFGYSDGIFNLLREDSDRDVAKVNRDTRILQLLNASPTPSPPPPPRVPRSIRINDATPTPSPPNNVVAAAASPPKLPIAAPYQDPHVHGGPIDVLNLWHAVPPNYDHKLLNLYASHLTDQDDGKLSQ
jgi:hypothetical protein